MGKKLPITLLSALLSIMLLPFAQAQFYDYFSYSMQSMFQSYLFNFTLFLLFFWLVCYLSLKSFFGGKMIPAVLAAIISLLITPPVLSNFGDTILTQSLLKWVLLGVAAIALLYFIRTVFKIFSGRGGGTGKFSFKWILWALVIIAVIIITGNWNRYFGKFIGYIPSSVSKTLIFVSGIIVSIGILYLIYEKFWSAEAKKNKEIRDTERARRDKVNAETRKTDAEAKTIEEARKNREKQEEAARKQEEDRLRQGKKNERAERRVRDEAIKENIERDRDKAIRENAKRERERDEAEKENKRITEERKREKERDEAIKENERRNKQREREEKERDEAMRENAKREQAKREREEKDREAAMREEAKREQAKRERERDEAIKENERRNKRKE